MRKEIKINVIGLILSLIMITTSLLFVEPIGDEKEFHYPTLINICKNPLNAIFSNEYLAANTPLPYYLNWLNSTFVPISLESVRVVTYIISLFSIYLIYRYIKKYSGVKIEQATKIIIIFLFYPSFIVCLYSFYIPNYGLFFIMLFFLCFDFKYGNNKQLLCGLALSFAVLSQQYYLAIYSSLVATLLIYYPFNLRYYLKLLILSIFLIIPFYIFYQWGGFTNEKFRFHGVSLTLENFISVFLIIGVYLFPYFIQGMKNINKYKIFFSFTIALFFVVFFFPNYSIELSKGSFNGLVFKSIVLTSKIHYLLPQIISLFVVSFGLYTTLNFNFKKESEKNVLLYTSSVFLIVVYLFSEVLFEKHLLPLIFLLFIIYLPKVKSKILSIYSILMLLLGVVYFIYWFFLKDFNG